MRATATKENATSHSRPQSSQPFFSKKEEGGFFSPEKETKPFFSPAVIQPKLTINEPGDSYEQEADAMADRVMRMSEAPQGEGKIQTKPLSISPIQRKCAECGQEERLQRQEMEEEEPLQAAPLMRKAERGGYTASPQLTSQLSSSKGGGSPLPGQTLGFMNQAFGSDFSNVRIHTGSQAAEMSQGIQAKAFTHGSDIYFNRGQYSPESSEGKRLLGHELTHVVQQGSNHHNIAPFIQRNVGASSKCKPNVHSAPADPIDRLTLLDARAQHMSLGCSHLLFVESMVFDDPVFGPSNVFNAYRDWFGLPVETSPGRWKSRFRAATFGTQNEAITHEMQELSNRFKRIHDWLSGSIRYVCPGTASVTLGGCAGPCGAASAMSCDDGTRKIAICPRFWGDGDTDDVLASFIIHEAAHAHLRFAAHPTTNAAGRGRNPGCYHGFAQEIYNAGIVTGGCTII